MKIEVQEKYLKTGNREMDFVSALAGELASFVKQIRKQVYPYSLCCFNMLG